jgi:hypothetical protein
MVRFVVPGRAVHVQLGSEVIHRSRSAGEAGLVRIAGGAPKRTVPQRALGRLLVKHQARYGVSARSNGLPASSNDSTRYSGANYHENGRLWSVPANLCDPSSRVLIHMPRRLYRC